MHDVVPQEVADREAQRRPRGGTERDKELCRDGVIQSARQHGQNDGAGDGKRLQRDVHDAECREDKVRVLHAVRVRALPQLAGGPKHVAPAANPLRGDAIRQELDGDAVALRAAGRYRCEGNGQTSRTQ